MENTSTNFNVFILLLIGVHSFDFVFYIERIVKEQMTALTSDIVWLDTMTVMVNGQPRKVVYPRVYTRANWPMTLQTDGALISASNLVINTKGAVANTGTLLGDTIVMQANRLQQGGYIQAKALGVTTLGDIVNTGTLDATDRVQLVAGRNVALTTDTLKAKQDMTQDSNNYLRTYRQTEVGTDIRGHDVTILANQDLTGWASPYRARVRCA